MTKNAVVSQDPIEVEIEWSGEPSPVKLKYVRASRWVRNQALEEAARAYNKKYPRDTEGGYLPSVFEKECVVALVKWWNLPRPPSQLWEQLDPEIGDKIAEAVGVSDLMGSLRGEETDEVKDAKNSSSDESNAPTPDSS